MRDLGVVSRPMNLSLQIAWQGNRRRLDLPKILLILSGSEQRISLTVSPWWQYLQDCWRISCGRWPKAPDQGGRTTL